MINQVILKKRYVELKLFVKSNKTEVSQVIGADQDYKGIMKEERKVEHDL